jgi:hypothetical protein
MTTRSARHTILSETATRAVAALSKHRRLRKPIFVAVARMKFCYARSRTAGALRGCLVRPLESQFRAVAEAIDGNQIA